MYKILHIVTSMDPRQGGVREVVNTYGNYLRDSEMTSDVVSFDNEELSNLSKNYNHFCLGLASGPFSFNAKFKNWLTINARNYSHVFVHGIWSYHSFQSVNTIFKMKASFRPKVYIMPHGMLDPWFQIDRSRKLKAIRNFIYWNLIEKNTINKADGLLFTCKRELELAAETFKGYAPKRTFNVGYGITSPPINDLQNSVTFKAVHGITEPYFLFLGRIDTKKGIDMLINAYIKTEELMVLPKLLIAGSISSRYAQEMILLAKGSNRITFLGMLEGESKWSAIYNAEAFILPSHQENFGIAIVEALACGVPVIITAKVNIYEPIVNEGAGLITEDSFLGCEHALRSWMSMDSQSKQVMKENAYRCFKRHFQIEDKISAVKKMLDV